jgi:hypothetical protein
MSTSSNSSRGVARITLRAAVAAACALLLSGCVVYPARPYGYYAPGYYYGGPPVAVYGGGGYYHGWR